MINNILILDDDESFLKACQVSLSTFKIVTANSIDKALQIIDNINVDVILLDHNLGVMTGEDFLNELNRRQKQRPAIILITGYADKDLAIRMIDHKIDCLLEKPISLNKLKDKLDSLIKKNYQMPSFLNEETKTFHDGDTKIQLTPLEFRILKVFVSNQDRIVLRTDLTKSVWGDTIVTKHTLDTHITRLKKKVPTLNIHLKSIYGTGFIFEKKI